MYFRKLMIFTLGLAGMVVPGRASLSYYTASGSFDAATSSLSAPYGVEVFDPGAGGFSGVTYTDATSGIEFTGLAASDGSQTDDLTVSPGTSAIVQQSGGYIEITNLPVNTLAIEINIDVPSSYGFFCAQANVSSFNCSGSNGTGTVYVSGPGTVEFMGAVSSGASPVAITNLWLGPASGNGAPQIDSFEIFTEATADAPERPTLLLLGGGLILLGLMRRRAGALSR